MGLTTFSDEIHEVVPSPLSRDRSRLKAAVDDLIAMGGTAFYDATAEAFARVRRVVGRDDRINALVVLSDGDDVDSERTLREVLPALNQGDRENPIRVFTIAYGAEATGAEDALKQIAATSGGRYYAGDTGDVETMYRSISSFF